MKTNLRSACLLLCSFLAFTATEAQELRTFHQNASRSNHSGIMSGDAWTFGINTGISVSLKNNEQALFRGNSAATKMFGRYYFGNLGLGFTSGILPGTISENAVNKFITERKFPQDQVLVDRTKPFSSYLLFGPSVRLGHRVWLQADLQAGLFFNNPGTLNIMQAGANRSLYRFDAGNKNLFPGISGSLSLAYPLNPTTHFFINTDYLQSKTSIRLLDPQAGVDIATQLNRDLKLFTAGIGISKSFGGRREPGSYLRAGRRQSQIPDTRGPGTGTREAGSGRATGRINARPLAGANTAISSNESCGPVTLTTTRPDGITEQRVFACPADAAQYNERISMNVTVPRQTQGTSFGEKVNQGLQAAGGAISQGAAKGTISGTVSWATDNASGITTNEMAAVSSVGNLQGGGGSGAASAAYAATGRMMNNTEGGQAVITRFYARETGSGMATGRRQYQPVFDEESGQSCTGCAVQARLIAHELAHTVQQSGSIAAKGNNPLYEDKGMEGNNPMQERKKQGTLCGSTGHFFAVLTNTDNGQTLAKTKVDSCGNFWFAQVPPGRYSIRIKGEILVRKEYEMAIGNTGRYDVTGEVLADIPALLIQLNSQREDSALQRTKVIVRGWDPAKGVSVAHAAAAFVAGQPIGGIIVKGGKNPGGNLRTTRTNEYGEFEFLDLDGGTYNISADIIYAIDDETIVSVSDK